MERDETQGLYIISIAARLADVHPQTLRLYERKGLLRPQRTPKNRRRYSDEDIDRLRRIQDMTQNQGLNLSGVRKVLEMEVEMLALRERLLEMEREVAEVQRRLVDEMMDIKRRVALSTRPPSSLVLRRKSKP
ncbi:MAG TPA: MerR family transcriptional regulator [Candidatus Anoxymicrobiaceae bacterium]|jgi:MerR family transcriptional regulator, heat shock protein HspR